MHPFTASRNVELQARALEYQELSQLDNTVRRSLLAPMPAAQILRDTDTDSLTPKLLKKEVPSPSLLGSTADLLGSLNDPIAPTATPPTSAMNDLLGLLSSSTSGPTSPVTGLGALSALLQPSGGSPLTGDALSSLFLPPSSSMMPTPGMASAPSGLQFGLPSFSAPQYPIGPDCDSSNHSHRR